MTAKETKKLIGELKNKINEKNSIIEMLEHGKNNPTVSPVYYSTKGQIEALESVLNLINLSSVQFNIL